jgi:hypothetical protein
MKGLTNLMVMMAYHFPYTKLSVCDEPWLICIYKKYLRGTAGLPFVDTLIIIMVRIIVSIAGRET